MIYTCQQRLLLIFLANSLVKYCPEALLLGSHQADRSATVNFPTADV
jgi:hypothetical protein